MPFLTFVHYVPPLSPSATPPPPPEKKKKKKKEKRNWILCQFVEKYTNTESSWQIIQIRKKIGWGVGKVCVVWASEAGWG